MYRDLREVYWWDGQKRDIEEFVSNCQNQQVKADHRKPSGIIQKMGVPTWKWEEINIDFVVGLLWTQRKNDLISKIVDILTNSLTLSPSSLLIRWRIMLKYTFIRLWIYIVSLCHCSIHISILEIVPKRLGYRKSYHNFSSPNGWSSEGYYSNSWGYVKSMCDRLLRESGRLLTIDWVLL